MTSPDAPAGFAAGGRVGRAAGLGARRRRVVIVTGPIGAEIRLDAGLGCLGPDPQRPAGARIGRALRLLQQNGGGALPGPGTMAGSGDLRDTNVVSRTVRRGFRRVRLLEGREWVYFVRASWGEVMHEA